MNERLLTEDTLVEIYFTVKSYNQETPADIMTDYGIEVRNAQDAKTCAAKDAEWKAELGNQLLLQKDYYKAECQARVEGIIKFVEAHKETSLFNKHGNIYIDPTEWQALKEQEGVK